MTKSLQDYTACWVRHEPTLDVNKIELVPGELADVSVELERAANGDADSAKSLVRRLCAAVDDGSGVDDRLLRYVAKALRVLVEDKTPNLSGFARALGVKSTGRPKRNQERDRKLYFAVRGHMRNKMTYDDACGLVAENNHLSQSTVETIYQEKKRSHLDFLRDMNAYSSEVTDDDWTAIRLLLEKEQAPD